MSSFNRNLTLAFALLLLCGPVNALDRHSLAIIINTADPLSVKIAEYYAQQRHITFQNLIRVSFVPGSPVMSRTEFKRIKDLVDRQTMPHVQAYALTWIAPYRVECMSMTSAFAFGFDQDFCAEKCQPTRVNPYFDAPSGTLHGGYSIKPTMVLSAESFDYAKQLIDRGIAADGLFPEGTAYLLSTKDSARNVRAASYNQTVLLASTKLRVRILRQDEISQKNDVLFYFTGLERVESIDTLQFVPGAVADHLTSFGGMLTDSPQMSALRWIQAGATGSFGTVVEPCNLVQKFPYPALLIRNYLKGDTLIEAYWKSVQMPGQGIFIGEPLSTPYKSKEAQQ